MKPRFNHNPFVYGINVPFMFKYLKDPYFITDKEGNTHDGMANGGGWHTTDNRIIENADVTHLRFAGDRETKWGRLGGGLRTARNIDYFGKNYPVYCGVEYGFVWPDELPEDKKIVPVRMFAHRYKRGEDKTITLFVAQGKIVDAKDEPAQDIGGIETLVKKYSEQPGFWIDPEGEIMSTNEIKSSIYQMTWFNEIVNAEEYSADAKQFIKILNEIGSPEWEYIPGFKRQLQNFISLKNMFNVNNELIRSHFVTSSIYKKVKNAMFRVINEQRGPEENKVDSEDWELFYKFIMNPSLATLTPPQFTVKTEK